MSALVHGSQSHEDYGGSVLYRSLHNNDRPLEVESASGMVYTLKNGRKVIDGCSGAAVTCLGEGNEAVIAAMNEQAKKCCFAYNFRFTTDPAEELADYICKSSDGAFKRVGFLCGGSEAVEAALKLARQYWLEQGEPERINIITRKMSYHGNTLGGLGASYHPIRKIPFAPILANQAFHYVEPADVYHQDDGRTDEEYVAFLEADLDAKFQELGGKTVIGFMCETVVGATTGATPPPVGYLEAVRRTCDKYGALMILDEVMSGMGRCGETHAWQAFGNVKPDLQTVAKGLGGGYQPIGAVLLSEKICNALDKGSKSWMHGHTYQCHPVGCAASLAVQKIVARDNLLENVRRQSTYIVEQLSMLLSSNPKVWKHVGNIRGAGLLLAVEFMQVKETKTPFPSTLKPRFGERVSHTALADHNLQLLSFSGGIDGKLGDFTMIAPAYTITTAEVDDLVTRFVKSVTTVVETI